jgi:hypothetical protein
MPRLELYPFRFRDSVTGKWVRARYRAEQHEIAARYAEYEIVGLPEIREVDPDGRYFNPTRDEREKVSIDNIGRIMTTSRPLTRPSWPVAGIAI